MKMQTKSIKLLILILFFAVGFFFLNPVWAKDTPTPSPTLSQNETPTDASDLSKIEKIKDIVASKVAELNLVEKRGLLGTVKDRSATEVTITDTKGQVREIDVDELTKFSDDNNKNFGISDIQKGQLYSFVGLYNKETQRLLARYISTASTIPLYFAGVVTDINHDTYVVTLTNATGEKKKIDIQGSTKDYVLEKDFSMQKAGFSKFTLGQRVLAVGFLNKSDNNLLEASRVIQFQDVIPPSKEMQQYVTTSEASGSAQTQEKSSK